MLLGSRIINFTYRSFILIFNFHHSILADVFLSKPQMGFSKIKIKLERNHNVRFILAISYNSDLFLTTLFDNISSAACNSKHQISLGG